MSSKRSLDNARRFIDKKNIHIINHNPIGTVVILDYINQHGILKPYETIITANERSELMVRCNALRMDDVFDSTSDDDDDDGFVPDNDVIIEPILKQIYTPQES